ncbi:hypothetical protein QM616_13380 [Rhodococcus fascians]|nr:hypothetical protein [Rhodococcus fascians]MDJ0003708.1 hypothetical protein [Rhodococcus fascians]
MRDRPLGEQRRFDLTQFDAQAAQLDLEVGTSDVFELAVAIPAHDVAGAVQPRTTIGERVGDEPVRGQVGASHIAARELSTGEIELTCNTDRGRMQSRIQHVDSSVPDRSTDRHDVGIRIRDRVVRHVHGRLGRSVQVVQFHRGDRTPQCASGGGR